MAQSTSIPAVQISGRAANKKIKFIVGGLAIAAAVVYLIVTGIQSTAAYFLTVDELYAKGAAMENRTVRVAGKVDAETIDFNNRDLVTDPLVTRMVGLNLPTQTDTTDVEAELDALLTRLIGGSGDTNAIMKGACASALGSAAMLVQ